MHLSQDGRDSHASTPNLVNEMRLPLLSAPGTFEDQRDDQHHDGRAKNRAAPNSLYETGSVHNQYANLCRSP